MRWQSLGVAWVLVLLTLTSTVHTRDQKGSLAAEMKHLKKMARLGTAQMLRSNGYVVEDHYAITEDGYVLHMFRIPSTDPPGERPPVLVQHGLLCSSDDWVVNGPGKALAYLLSDAGYDVWLGNGRGNTYSKNHVVLSSKSSKFWKFSWHEQGVYDVPAMIDHMLHVTGQQDIFYIGHSMGTTMFFVMGSEKPAYNKKIRAAFLMAPVGYMQHITSRLLTFMSDFKGPLTTLLEWIGVDEFAPSNELTKLASNLVCSEASAMKHMCANILFHAAGFNEKEINKTMLPVYLAHSPAGASVRQLLHYAQEISSGGYFRQYDYGPRVNRNRYRSRFPPDYLLSSVKAPVMFLYGNYDCLCKKLDVTRAFNELGNPIGMHQVKKDGWSHLDFMWGIHARELVYEVIFEHMKRFWRRPDNITRISLT